MHLLLHTLVALQGPGVGRTTLGTHKLCAFIAFSSHHEA